MTTPPSDREARAREILYIQLTRPDVQALIAEALQPEKSRYDINGAMQKVAAILAAELARPRRKTP